MKKIIHIATDEKFINSAHWQFEKVFPGNNRFYLLVQDRNKQMDHVDLTDDFTLIKNDFPTLKSLAKSFQQKDLIIFHGLDYRKSYLAHHLHKNIKIIWVLWGFEFYNNPEIIEQDSVLGPITRAYRQAEKEKVTALKEKDDFKKRIKILYQKLYYKIKFGTPTPNVSIRRTIERADYCAILYREEFDYIRDQLGLDAEYIKFSYYPIELMVKNKDSRIKGENILLGNSSSRTNNHLEAFQILKKLPLGKRQIITPLSYGNKFYAKEVIEEGKKIFPHQFHPLVEFMPLHEYNEFLESCGIVIMNHYRQQAVGNVLTMLWMGAKVYLDEKNSLFHYLRNLGIIIFSIKEDLKPENEEVFKLLSYEEQNHNRKILKKEIGEEVLQTELKQQINSITRKA